MLSDSNFDVTIRKNLRILLGITGILIVFIAMVTVPQLVEKSAPPACIVNGDGECPHEDFLGLLNILIPIFIGGGAVLGAVALYLFYEKTKPSEREYDASLALSLMEKEEGKVVNRIVEEGGRITQSEISRIEGIGKVKAHRILRKLEKKGLLKREQYGKTNMVKISEKYRKLLLRE